MSESMGYVEAETKSDYTEYEAQAQKLEQEIADLTKERDDIISSITGEDTAKWEAFNKGRRVMFHKKFLVERDGVSSKEEISLGALLTDHEWNKDTRYKFDNSVQPEIKIQYVKELFGTRIREKEFNYHVIKTLANDSFTSILEKKSYEDMYQEYMAGSRESEEGVEAEKLTYTFTKSFSLEFPEIGLEIRIPKAKTDLKGKADLIASRHLIKNKTGVINEIIEEEVHNSGIQLTITSMEHLKKIADEGKDSHKANKFKQIDTALKRELKKAEPDYEDLFIVSFTKQTVIETINSWKKEGCPAGGPSNFLSKESKKYLIENLLQKLYTKEEINALLRKANLV